MTALVSAPQENMTCWKGESVSHIMELGPFGSILIHKNDVRLDAAGW